MELIFGTRPPQLAEKKVGLRQTMGGSISGRHALLVTLRANISGRIVSITGQYQILRYPYNCHEIEESKCIQPTLFFFFFDAAPSDSSKLFVSNVWN